jgi:hypothetical protein
VRDPREMRHVDGSVMINKTAMMFQIAQLRHAYTHLKAERVVKQEMLADNLLSPVIESLERMIK